MAVPGRQVKSFLPEIWNELNVCKHTGKLFRKKTLYFHSCVVLRVKMWMDRFIWIIYVNISLHSILTRNRKSHVVILSYFKVIIYYVFMLRVSAKLERGLDESWSASEQANCLLMKYFHVQNSTLYNKPMTTLYEYISNVLSPNFHLLSIIIVQNCRPTYLY